MPSPPAAVVTRRGEGRRGNAGVRGDEGRPQRADEGTVGLVGGDAI